MSKVSSYCDEEVWYSSVGKKLDKGLADNCFMVKVNQINERKQHTYVAIINVTSHKFISKIYTAYRLIFILPLVILCLHFPIC